MSEEEEYQKGIERGRQDLVNKIGTARSELLEIARNSEEIDIVKKAVEIDFLQGQLDARFPDAAIKQPEQIEPKHGHDFECP